MHGSRPSGRRAALRHAVLKTYCVDVSTSANVRNVCSFLNSPH
ncbi:hypothetical protein BF49_5304 [Bradyrhizobium sp.]|nr:hypothetical protein BF49_5304 [Bradyrhizobium sp.]